MSKSFDDIFKDRLGNLEKAPPYDAKKAILGQVSTPSMFLEYFYKVIAGTFILLCFYQVGKKDNRRKYVSDIDHPVQIATQQPIFLNKTKLTESVKFDQRPLAQKEVEDSGNLKVIEEKKTILKKSLPKGNFKLVNEIKEADGFDLSLLQLQGELNPRLSFSNKKGTAKKVIPKEERRLYPYYNLGGFFMYNRVKPNLADDIYVGEYDSPFGMSPSRIGLALEGGIHRQWNERLASRLGLSINNFNQSYSFTVRNLKPDSVSVSSSSGFLEPHFDKEHVKINKRVSVVGIKGQMFFYVFPNHANVLFSSFEYQHLVGQGPKFKYQDRKYSLMKSSQYLVEVGLRKLIFDRKQSELFLMPNIRYSVNKFRNQDIIAVKPFSVGVTLSYQRK